jgi:hypothetical protein
VQLTDVVRAQEPPDYVTQLHTAGAGVYCSPVCAWLHLLESLILDGDLPRESLNARTAVTQPTPCEAAATPRPVHEEPF